MNYLEISHKEVSTLLGLPYLHQITYLLGVRPHMDRKNNLVGVNPLISYQIIAEALYIKPYPGIKSSKPNKQQIRRIIYHLEKIGLIAIQSEDQTLILKCLLANYHPGVQNKADTEVDTQPDTGVIAKHPYKSRLIDDSLQKADTDPNTEADTPLCIRNNYYIYLSQQFEKFWTLYPLKKSKQSAWIKFQALQPNEDLLARIFRSLEEQILFYNQAKSQGQWLPDWKYPANWLAQHCWEDEINPNTLKEVHHATHQKRSTSSQSCDPFWDSCKGGVEQDATSNIIELHAHRKG